MGLIVIGSMTVSNTVGVGSNPATHATKLIDK